MTIFYCDPVDLLQALNRCSQTIKDSNTHKFASYVLLEIGEDSLGVHSSDSFVTVCNSIPLHQKEGSSVSVCVSHRALKQWLDNSFVASNNIKFSFDGAVLTAKATKGRKARFVTAEVDFPSVFELDSNEEISRIDGDDFTSGITRVATLASSEAYNDVLKYVCFILRGDIFELLATDSFIFGYYYGPAKNTQPDAMELLIDSRAFLAVSGAVKQFDTVRVYRRERQGRSDIIFFSAGDCYAYTQIPSGKRYPDVKSFLSEDHPNKARVSREEMRRALLASKGFTISDEKRPTLISFDTEMGAVKIGSAATERGSNVDVIENAQLIGGSIEIRANIDYLVGALDRIDGMDAWLHLDKDANGVPKMAHISDVTGRQRFVIAPMREYR